VPDTFKQFLPYLVLRLSNKLNLDLMADLRRHKINLARWRVLAVLNIRDGQNIGEMSDAAMMEQSALSRTIMRMEEEGFVKRKLLKSDNRYVQVFLTKAGKELFGKLYPIVLRRHDRCVKGMTEAEVSQLLNLLHRALDNLEDLG
jgi:DNA-binding MarR family transcriptional regulator